ncbi:poly-gamma-glutamate biosynthesis protein PgsC/CapC [Marinobacter sp. MDS2]|uniref:poly-gamma-glutamate biosynthesis protein PgsC/CapC n=1 Tax=Marinobacter sp. MDS2 TaxID=3065961 RepID=UPI00273AB8A3|nr:poly-gamma-glutamate biosynthesis protein PgsC/CapC [Marinobacter sp. MDS2]MDP4547377.1 poly-gamma-glutamate biosynthesis protein PgsC/CapC [Marinobacter sp. MDS2]
MDSFFPLTIFPPGGLSSSVITTVWVGVCVVAFLNLRFGTMLSGLVVPGYLIPLLIVRPVSGYVVLIEGIATYAIGRVLAEHLPKRLGYSEMFGRDRFFALVLISVVVRISFDGALLPYLNESLGSYGLNYDFQNNLHSFGLIVVALIANQFWNGGFRTGATSLLLYLTLTYLLVRFVLMEVTNFNINTLSYMYEDLASSILASPKAYIVLLTSAFIASRMNIKYGWEYNGILIPSLLALQWYQPAKLAATFVEALVIYFAAQALLKAPMLRNSNIEGARQLLFFFTISFVYKLILGFGILEWAPASKITDYYGFGYLLATLMAMKMYQKDVAPLLLRASLQTSLTAVLVASLIGFALTRLPGQEFLLDRGHDKVTVQQVRSQQPLTYFHKRLGRAYQSNETQWFSAPTPIQLEQMQAGLTAIKRYVDGRAPEDLREAASRLGALDLQIDVINERYLVIFDADTQRGWGWYVINLQPKSPLNLQVPAPLDEPGAAETGIWKLLQQQATTLAMAGVRRSLSPDGASDTLLNPSTLFQVFHRTFSRQSALQIRGFTGANARPLLGLRDKSLLLENQIDESQIWITRKFPQGLNLALLQQQVPDLTLNWAPAPLENRQRDASTGGFAELFISPSSRRHWVAYKDQQGGGRFESSQRIDGYLQQWLTDSKNALAEKGSGQYLQPELGDLIYFDQMIFTPLYRLIHGPLKGGWNKDYENEITRLSTLANAYGYRVSQYHHLQSQQHYLILSESPENLGKRRFWGTYVFRLGPAQPLMIQVPRPLYELNTFEFGATLFEESRAKVFMIAGAHPYTNADGTSDVLHSANPRSLFNLLHQVWFREARTSVLNAIQVRTFGDEQVLAQSKADVILSAFFPLDNDLWKSRIVSQLTDLGLTTDTARGTSGTRGYETDWNAQTRYLPLAANKQIYSLWLAPDTNRRFRSAGDDRQQRLKFESIGIPTLERPLSKAVAVPPQPKDLSSTRIANLRRVVRDYLDSGNITFLDTLQSQFGTWRFQRIIDPSTQQDFLLVRNTDEALILLANLHPTKQATVSLSQSDVRAGALADAITNFADSRNAFLIWEASK